MKLNLKLLTGPHIKSSKMTLNNIFEANANSSIALAYQAVVNGNVIAVPTDTVYGLACNANNSHAIKKLYSIKGRDMIKPVAICVADLDRVKTYGKAYHLPDSLLNELLPGPITIVLEKTKNLTSPFLNPGINKIGIRIPKSNFIQNLCAQLDHPLALTSANKSNEPSSLSIKEFAGIWNSLACVFDGGILSQDESSRSASTVVDLSVEGKYKIIRSGIAVEKIIHIFHKYDLKNSDL